MEWVLKNREAYNIRVLNISLGADHDVPLAESRIDMLAEECVKQGIVVVAAAGNSGDSHSVPPANPRRSLLSAAMWMQIKTGEEDMNLYTSSYGATCDGTIKPEIIAPATNIAAPIPARNGRILCGGNA